jgi:hypothetical protein
MNACAQPVAAVDASALLCTRGLDTDMVVEHLRGAIDLSPGDMLLLVGSVADQLGNECSDVDLLLVTDRDDICYTSLRDIVLPLRGAVVDIRVVSVCTVENLVSCFSDWAAKPRLPREATAFSPAETKLLHRIKNGISLYGMVECASLQRSIDQNSLSRNLIDASSYRASTFQVDMAGFYRSQDLTSLHFAGQQLLGHIMDALLASCGMTNVNPKWRVKQLSFLPDDWESAFFGRKSGMNALGLYLELSSFSKDDTDQMVVDRAQSIAALARRVLPVLAWDHGRAIVQPSLPAGRIPDDRPLPQLDFDVAVQFRNGHYELFRLNQPSSIFSLTAREYSIVCLCDGRTSLSEAYRYAESLDECKPHELVEQLIALIGHGNLEARSYVDETALGNLLVM